MLIHFIHGYYCIYRPWQPLTYLYFPYHCISLIYFSFTKIRMFLYAQIYWLAEFGTFPVYSLTIWEWRLSLRPGMILSDNLVGHLSDNFKSEVRQNSVSDLRVWSLIHLEGSVYTAKKYMELTCSFTYRTDNFIYRTLKFKSHHFFFSMQILQNICIHSL